MRPLLLALLLLLLALAPGRAATRLPAGAALGDVTVYDLDDHPVSLRRYAGQVVVLLHEDKDTGPRNQAFKDQLGLLAERHPGAMQVIALCEVSRFDFWPARRYVKEALRKVRDQGALVLIDWKGELRRRVALPPGDTNCIVLGRDGRVALALRGDLSPAEAQTALAEIGRLLPRP